MSNDLLAEYRTQLSEAASLMNRVFKASDLRPPKLAPFLCDTAFANILAGADEAALKLLKTLRGSPAQDGDDVDDFYDPRTM